MLGLTKDSPKVANWVDPRNPFHGQRCRVIDLDTGEQIIFLLAANEETGEYTQYVRDGDKFVIDPETNRVATRIGKARLQIQVLADDEPYLLADTPRIVASGR